MFISYAVLRERIKSFLTETYSSIAQSVERMTVNHDVVGSSPTGGVIGAWLSLVERSVRDREVAGSNPVAPTFFERSYLSNIFSYVSIAQLDRACAF